MKRIYLFLLILIAGVAQAFSQDSPEIVYAEWTVNGPEGLFVKYTYNNRSYSYSDGAYLLDDIVKYGSVEISVNSGYENIYKVDKVTDENGRTYSAVAGKVTVPVTNYIKGDGVRDMTFDVTTSDVVRGELSTASVELFEGNLYDIVIYVNNTVYDFFSGRTVEIEYDAQVDEIFITSQINAIPNKITIDDLDIPMSEWDYNSSKMSSGILLTPGDRFYPPSGSRIAIYMEAPDRPSYNILFSFNDNAYENFISDLMVNNTYLRNEDFEDAMTNGLVVKEGSSINMVFNNSDYAVNSITLNGDVISTKAIAEYSNYNITGDLAFGFNLTPLEGNVVYFNVPALYEYAIVGTPDGVSYKLPSSNCSLELPRSVSRINVSASGEYVVQENGVFVSVPGEDDAQTYSGGTYFNVVSGMTVTVNITENTDNKEITYLVYSPADVLEFTGVGADYEPASPNAKWNAPTVEGASGYYTLTNIPATSITVTVKEAYRDSYKIQSINYNGNKNPSYDNGVSASIPVYMISGNASFTVVFENEDTSAKNITIEVNIPAAINRIYNANGDRLTSFPAVYDLNNGTELTIEVRNHYSIESVTCNGNDLITKSEGQDVIISLKNVEEGQIVSIVAKAEDGEYVYTFTGVEGLIIKYNGVEAEFVDGQYKVTNVYESTLGLTPLTVTVQDSYKNDIVLENVTYGTVATWVASMGQVNIPGSELPHSNASFRVNTRTPDVSETTRTVYIYIDNIEAVQYGVLRGGSSDFFSFNETGYGKEAVATLTISPAQYEVQIVTSVNVTKIETSVENTVEIPSLPSMNIELDLSNVVADEEISLFTISSSISDVETDNSESGIFYNLQGVRVNRENLAPGLYLQDGKKVIIK